VLRKVKKVSHFYTIALVPKDAADVEEKICEMLDPYDENKMVPEYNDRCYCVGNIANADARRSAEENIGHMEDFRNSFYNIIDAMMSEFDIEPNSAAYYEKRYEIAKNLDWDKHVERYINYFNEQLKSHPLYESATPDCEECQGTGLVKTTYNPKSKWDWWVVGGRWNGQINDNYAGDGDGGFNFGSAFHQLEKNSIPTTNLIKLMDYDRNLPFAIIDQNGNWFEKGEMGWWASVSNEKPPEEWKDIVIEILKKNANTIAVGLDLHI